jgi:two-component system nitrogen regulation response regulator NtrX
VSYRKRGRILVVDDEPGIRETLTGVLEDEGYDVESAESGERCLEMLGSRTFPVVLLDIWLPGIDGLETLKRISQIDAPQRPVVVMISGHGSIESAVRATKLGAHDFLEKPLSVARVTLAARNALEHRNLLVQNASLRATAGATHRILGNSVPMKAVRHQIKLMAPTNGRVLIYGESGTGKELVAHAIHAESPRSEGRFVEVNCAAIPEELIESVLFGHVRSTLEGATKDKTGKFQLADGGTLFLDEVGDMSLKTQAKVLRVIEEQRFEPVGSGRTVQVDVRVIAATNKHLQDEISSGNFREDLFYRLNVVPFQVPPLRDRADDIPVLGQHFLDEFSANYGRRPKRLLKSALDVLAAQSWPGNVRELRNLMERIVILHNGREVGARHIPVANRVGRKRRRPTTGFTSLKEAREAYERQYVKRTLEATRGNVTRAAEALGLERSNLHRKMRTLGIRTESANG